MFLNDVSLRLRWSQRCCYPSCLLPSFPVHRSRFPVHESIAVNSAVWRSKAFNHRSGAIVPDHTVRPLAPPYSAVYGVSLWTLPPCGGGVPVVWGGSRPGGSRCGVVGYCLQWGGVDSGYSPTIGVPLWWGAPYSGDRWIVGASQYWVRADCGLVRIVGTYLLLKL